MHKCSHSVKVVMTFWSKVNVFWFLFVSTLAGEHVHMFFSPVAMGYLRLRPAGPLLHTCGLLANEEHSLKTRLLQLSSSPLSGVHV